MIQDKAEELSLLRNFLFTLKATQGHKRAGERERVPIGMFIINHALGVDKGLKISTRRTKMKAVDRFQAKGQCASYSSSWWQGNTQEPLPERLVLVGTDVVSRRRCRTAPHCQGFIRMERSPLTENRNEEKRSNAWG